MVIPSEILNSRASFSSLEYPIERFGKLLTICYLILDTQCGKVLYSNAALPLPFLIRADGRVETLIEGGTIIGIGEAAAYEEGAVFIAGDLSDHNMLTIFYKQFPKIQYCFHCYH